MALATAPTLRWTVLLGDDRRTHGVDKGRVPLRVEAQTAQSAVASSDDAIAAQVFGDGDLPGLTVFDLGVDPPQQIPAFGDVVGGIVAAFGVADVGRGVEAQAVAAIVRAATSAH
jgi:hypothetical protein